MEALPQTLLFGILRSGLYALTALGLAISLGVIGVVNFAHGEFVMLGAYIGFWLYMLLSGPLGLGPAVSPLVIAVGIPLSAVALYLVATGVYRLTLRPVLRQPELNQMLLTFGLSILLVNGASITLTPQAKDANLDWRFDVLDLGFASVTYARLAVFAVCIALVLASYLLLMRSRLGKQMRAVAQNRLGAQIVGIHVDRVYEIAFGMSAALAAAAGVMLVFQTQVSPFVGLGTLLKAFSIVVLAGLGNLTGVLWASLLLGLAEQVVSQYVPGGSALRDGLFFVIIFVVLLARPGGLRR
ncbi:MAG TPA: branched-chain amino acid ABC transporter permease [Candidatus Limnocylindria bacterium]|nr:branched-chain amino acid ABC transporter permease [Candidatus Limnocylindria bacterium]